MLVDTLGSSCTQLLSHPLPATSVQTYLDDFKPQPTGLTLNAGNFSVEVPDVMEQETTHADGICPYFCPTEHVSIIKAVVGATEFGMV